MGRNCCCGWRMSGCVHIDMTKGECIHYDADPNGCTCDWNGWVSCFDYPNERKNKHIPFSLPEKNGKYLVRIQDCSGDRYEKESIFSLIPRTINSVYTGEEIKVNWEGYDDEQPYAWKEIETEG